jgi:hypothetical protein
MRAGTPQPAGLTAPMPVMERGWWLSGWLMVFPPGRR